MRVSRKMLAPMLGVALMATTGCVQVSAPDKPIEINLNVNIKQEVVVKVQREAEDLVKSNPGIY